MLEIEIDGKKAQVPDGSTVMDAAQQLGVYVPHFCYHKKLSIAANCRMCLVQVEKAPKPLPACATPVTNGMKVFTHSELAIKAQKGVMEFLLINHPLDCPICDQGGECQLQDMSVGYGPMKSRYAEEKRVVFHKNIGPLVSMEEMSRCIHCTRCVRFGQEIAGVMELGMANRNMHSEITTFLGRTVDSELSGNMIDLCPVGALTSKPFRYTARAWELQRRRTISPHDSVGANLVAQVKHDKVYRMLPYENEAVNECWISDKERYSYLALDSEERLTRPMVKQGGEWHEVDWAVALDYVAHGFRDLVTQHGVKSIAAFAHPSATLEEMGLLKKLFKGLGSDDVDFRLRHVDSRVDRARLGLPSLGIPLAELADQDAILVVGSFLRKDHPLIAQRIRQAARKLTQVSMVSLSQDDQLIALHAQRSVAPDSIAAALAEILTAVSNLKSLPFPLGIEQRVPSAESQRIAESLCQAEKSLILLGNACNQLPDSPTVQVLVQHLTSMTASTISVLAEAGNTLGGYKVFGTNLNVAAEILKTPRKGYFLFGLEPELDFGNPQRAMKALKDAALVVSLSPFKSQRALEYADVLLPISPFTETSGTFVNLEGRVQSFSGVVRPLGDSRPGWKVLRVLGNVLNLDGFNYTSSEEIRDEVLGAAEASFITGLSNQVDQSKLVPSPFQQSNQVLRISDVPIHFADSIVRRSYALQQTQDAREPQAVMNQNLATHHGFVQGQSVVVRQGEGAVRLTLCVDASIPDNCVLVSAAHPSTAVLGEMFGEILLEQA